MRISLKAARINANLTQEELAAAVNVNKKTVAAWENGKSLPKADKIDEICQAVNMPYDNIQWQQV